MSSRNLSFILPICGGLLVGATAIRLAQLSPRAQPAPAAQPPGPAMPRAVLPPGLVLPPKLAPAEAEAALDAWLVLGAPSDGAAPAPLSTQERALRALLTVLSDAQFPRLLETLHRRPGEAAVSLRQTVIEIWLHRNPPAAAAWVLTADLPAEGDTRFHLARKIGMFWAGQDAPAAVAWAESIPDPGLSTGVLERILPNLAPLDPDRALALARARGPEFFAKVRDSIFGKWAEQDPAAAFGALGAEILAANPESWRVRDALAHWVKKDFSASLAWLQTHDERHKDNDNPLLDNVLMQTHWFRGVQSTVLDGLLRHREIPRQSERVSRFLETWHRQQPAAASAWLARLPDAAARADLIERVVPTGGSDPTHAQSYLELAAQLPAGPARDDRIAGWVATWAQADPAAASAWLEAREKTDPSLAVVADGVEGRLVAALAATDPAAALARFPDLPPEARGAAAPAIALAWAKTDPAAATRWLAEQLPGIDLDPQQRQQLIWMSGQDLGTHTAGSNLLKLEPQAQAFSESVFQWSRREPLAALRWAEALTDPLQREIALEGIARRGGQGPNYAGTPRPDPRARADLINQIQDPAERSGYLSSHLVIWLRANEEQARAWLDAHDTFTPEETARLLEQANRTFP